MFERTELDSSTINEYNLLGDSLVPNAKRLSNSSSKYNCHSYAWYSQSTKNPYWMNDPTKYYTDGSYYEVALPQVGDIICYFDDNNTPNDKSDDENIHSGVVASLNGQMANDVCGNANIVNVTSKWGSCGLYLHNGVDCPYTSTYGGSADYVKFFRTAKHIHSYNNWKYYNSSSHIEECECGATGHKTKPHIILMEEIRNNKANCIECKKLLDLNLDRAITKYSTSNYKYSKNGSYIIPNGIIVLKEDDVEAYYNNSLIFYNYGFSLIS